MKFFRPACLCLTGLLSLSLSFTSTADSLASEVEADLRRQAQRPVPVFSPKP